MQQGIPVTLSTFSLKGLWSGKREGPGMREGRARSKEVWLGIDAFLIFYSY